MAISNEQKQKAFVAGIPFKGASALTPEPELIIPFSPTSGTGGTAAGPVATAVPPPAADPRLAVLQEASTDLAALKAQLDANRSTNGESTIGESLGFSAPTGQSAFPSYEEIYGSPINEGDVQQDTLRMFQAEIDAVNEAYDQLRQDEVLMGTGRLGRQRAMAARGGILGSDFAASQKGKVQDFNTGQLKGIEAERQARIGSILGTARQTAAQEIANKRAARQQGAENYLAYLASAGDRRQSNIEQLATSVFTQGFAPEEILDELTEAANQMGVPIQDVIAAYHNIKAGGGGGDRDPGQFTLSEGEQRYDSQGNLIAQGPASSPGSGKIFSTSKGLVRVNDTGETELIFPTSGSGSGSGVTGETFKSGGLVVQGAEVSRKERELNALRGSDGYTDSGAYLSALNEWTGAGGLEADFFKAFDPSDWVNPNDTSLPKRVRDRATDSGGGLAGLLGIGGSDITGAAASTDSTGPITEEDTGAWWQFWSN